MNNKLRIIDVLKSNDYLDEYCQLCSMEWGTKKTPSEMQQYIKEKKEKILSGDKVISILGLVDNETLIGFISLFKYDGEYRQDLTPWYATMYVKKEYRKQGYSKILNAAIIDKAKELGYGRVYLKTDLNNYYEKFGAKSMETLPNQEKLYYINCK